MVPDDLRWRVLDELVGLKMRFSSRAMEILRGDAGEAGAALRFNVRGVRDAEECDELVGVNGT